ncbi:DUF805 domain-containing protein [Formicincola oecophyllae]|uniref:DUF805 domain-containing protein n=1 Tax=Formicincola oecophyllae TaxID=2558361 RepID=A0A4Y6UC89_9PROT|nr:DUF805 domain-containing protein [Formicincola oecophyllae]QDH14188.1 DUF805 domain-containing protein [Formicincola oecophyllae]
MNNTPPSPSTSATPTLPQDGWGWIMQALKNYAVFSGRSPRRAFWWCSLFQFGAVLVANLGDMLFNTGNLLSAQVWLGLLLPTLAVGVRRLHDTGRSAWWVFINMPFLAAGWGLWSLAKRHACPEHAHALVVAGGALFIIGLALTVAQFVFECLPSQPGPNKYGPNPYNQG